MILAIVLTLLTVIFAASIIESRKNKTDEEKLFIDGICWVVMTITAIAAAHRWDYVIGLCQ